MGLYGDVIAELDDSVGQILACLKRLAVDQNTLVIFTSDNGPWFGGSTGGLRGMKGKSWDGGVRVPMIARWPGRIPPGQLIPATTGTIDIFPTALASAGLPLPDDRIIDWKNLIPLFRGEVAHLHDGLLIMTADRVKAIRSGRWKLHLEPPAKWPDTIFENPQYVDSRAPDGRTILAPRNQPGPDHYPGIRGGIEERPTMLFDLAADPSESHDVSSQNPVVVTRLREVSRRLTGAAPQ